MTLSIPKLSVDLAAQVIRQNRGFIPIDVEHQDGEYRIVWLDVGDYQFTEAKFRYSIQQLTAHNRQLDRFTTDLSLLTSNEFQVDALYPSGFIFHMSRCGSTLFAKSLARAPQHLVIDEGTPLNNGLWHYFTNGWHTDVTESEENFTLFRNILLAMGRRRASTYQSYFVKFRSWNVVFIDFIRRAFPDIPCLFIYRDPAEVIVSGFMRPVWILDFKGLPPGAFLTGKSVEETEAMSKLEFLTAFYERYLESALFPNMGQLHHLNYEQIKAQNMASILQHAFDYPVTPEMLEQIQVQFSYYSKDDSDTIRFSSDKEDKQRAITPEIRQAVARNLRGYYEELNRHPWNLKQWL